MAIEDVGSVVENDPDRAALEEKSDEAISEEVTEEVEEPDSDGSEGEDSGEGDGETSEEEIEEETEVGEEVVEEEKEEEPLSDDTLYQQLKSHDPALLKKFPELRATIFREQKYAELFPTVDDAKEAQEQVEVFKQFQQDITAGESGTILEALNKTGKKELENYVANFIPAVEKLNPDLYLRMLYPQFKKLLRAAAASTDERISVAAMNVHHFVFNDGNLDAEVGLKPPQKDAREDEFSRKEQEFEQRQRASFVNDLVESTEKAIKKELARPLLKSGLSTFLQTKIIDEAFDRINLAVGRDARHMGNIRKLLDNARKEGYTTKWKDSIKSAQLSRAKVLIPKIRQAVLAEAKETNTKLASKTEKIRISPGTSAGKQKVDPKKFDWGQEDADRKFLEQG